MAVHLPVVVQDVQHGWQGAGDGWCSWQGSGQPWCHPVLVVAGCGRSSECMWSLGEVPSCLCAHLLCPCKIQPARSRLFPSLWSFLPHERNTSNGSTCWQQCLLAQGSLFWGTRVLSGTLSPAAREGLCSPQAWAMFLARPGRAGSLFCSCRGEEQSPWFVFILWKEWLLGLSWFNTEVYFFFKDIYIFLKTGVARPSGHTGWPQGGRSPPGAAAARRGRAGDQGSLSRQHPLGKSTSFTHR